MRYEDFNGLTDTFESGWDWLKQTATDVATAVDYGLTTSTKWVGDKSSELTNDAKNQLLAFQKEVEKLLHIQKQVDEKLSAIPEGSALRQKLEAKKNQARGIFEEYIAPAWEQFISWSGIDSESNVGQLGALPIAIAAVLGAVAVGMAWVGKAYAIEKSILDDPELKKQYTAGVASSSSNIAKAVQYGAWGLGLVAAAMLAQNFFGSRK